MNGESRAAWLRRKRREVQDAKPTLAEIREQEAVQRACDHSAGADLVAMKCRNGTMTYADHCRRCGKFLRSYKHEAVTPADIKAERDDSHLNPPCVVCGAFGTELHHWAPKEFFDWEADYWPTSHLCPECHARWHTTMRQQIPYKQRQQNGLASARKSLGYYRGGAA